MQYYLSSFLSLEVSMTTPTKTKEKDPTAIQIGQRIKQAREMAGLTTQKALNDILVPLHGWSTSRLGNYESGFSIPHPDDLKLIADSTSSSVCWLTFGAGPIRASHRDRQAVRAQNLSNAMSALRPDQEALSAFLQRARTDAATLQAMLDNPFRPIGDRLARQFERALDKPNGWFDEQHIEHDPICARFPDDLRDLMALYSAQTEQGRKLILEVVRTMARTLHP